MKIERDDVCVQCGKMIPAQGLGMVCYSCSKEDDGRPMRTDEIRDDSIRIMAVLTANCDMGFCVDKEQIQSFKQIEGNQKKREKADIAVLKISKRITTESTVSEIKRSESSDHAVSSVHHRKRISFLHRLLSKTKGNFSPDDK